MELKIDGNFACILRWFLVALGANMAPKASQNARPWEVKSAPMLGLARDLSSFGRTLGPQRSFYWFWSIFNVFLLNLGRFFSQFCLIFERFFLFICRNYYLPKNGRIYTKFRSHQSVKLLKITWTNRCKSAMFSNRQKVLKSLWSYSSPLWTKVFALKNRPEFRVRLTTRSFLAILTFSIIPTLTLFGDLFIPIKVLTD